MNPSCRSILLLASALAGCSGPRDHAEPPVEQAGRVLDSVPELISIPLKIESQPWGPTALALSPTGTLAYLFGQDDPPYLTLVGSDGQVRQRVGQKGEGPGELSGVGSVLFDGRYFAVVDRRRGAIVRFDPATGEYRGEVRHESNGFPLALVGDSIDEFDAEYAVRRIPPAVRRFSLIDGGSRTILDSHDSIFSLALGTRTNNGPLRGPIPYFHDSRGTIWADAASYTIRYVLDGTTDTVTLHRELPPNHRGELSAKLQRAALERAVDTPLRTPSGKEIADNSVRSRLDTLDREVLPYILPGGLGMDSRGRVVAVGMSDDSTFVDFFRDERFLHREVIDCFTPGRVVVGQDRIALHCRSRTTDPEYHMQVWAFK